MLTRGCLLARSRACVRARVVYALLAVLVSHTASALSPNALSNQGKVAQEARAQAQQGAADIEDLVLFVSCPLSLARSPALPSHQDRFPAKLIAASKLGFPPSSLQRAGC